MVKKLKQMADKQAASGKSAFDSALAGAVKESAQQIWLAGMGAFAKAQAEGGKVFETLVKEGVSLQRKTQSAAESKLSDVGQKMSSMAGEVSAKAGQQWDKLESIFEDRVARSLKKLGVPSAKDVDALIERIDALGKQVAQLSKAKATPAKTAAKAAPKAAAKTAPRKAAAKAPAKTAAKPAAKKAARKAA